MVIDKLLKALGGAFSLTGKAAHSLEQYHLKNVAFQGLFMAPVLFSHKDPSEKTKELGAQAGLFFLTAGMGSGRMVFYQAALQVGMGIPHAMKGLAHSYRSMQESRTSLAVPFSHSSVSMDQAYASLQYAKQRVAGGYTSLGSEAAFFASRYTSR